MVVISIALVSWWTGKNNIFLPDKKVGERIEEVVEKPLEKYTIENLAKTTVPQGEIKRLDENLIEFSYNPNLDGKTVKKTTGMMRVPEGAGSFPLIIMNRGYVDQEIYQTGIGTSKASEYFAKNGFITIALDFLGYAGSDPEAQNIFESRFQTYTAVLSLINSLDQIKNWDGRNIFMWGHSNGGQISLTILETSGKRIPTVLWAPVSKPFPYSILYYTDESDDRGKFIRKELASFEDLYNTDLYSLTEYLSLIRSPIVIHQGTADDAVPVDWSQSLTNNLKTLEKDVTLHIYPGADHNLVGAWNTAVQQDLTFFRENIK